MTLSDTHLVLLSAAAQHDHHLLARPDKLFGRALERLAARLTSAGLAEEVPVNQDQPHWSGNDAGEAIGLRITAAGLAALGITDEATDPPVEASEQSTSAAVAVDAERSVDQASAPVIEPARPQPRPGTKQALLVDMLRQEHGASVEAIMAATGWLSHTVRAALTGLRKKGYHLAKDRSESGTTIYRLTEAAVVAGTSPAEGGE